jgi:hypothetical protein
MTLAEALTDIEQRRDIDVHRIYSKFTAAEVDGEAEEIRGP